MALADDERDALPPVSALKQERNRQNWIIALHSIPEVSEKKGNLLIYYLILEKDLRPILRKLDLKPIFEGTSHQRMSYKDVKKLWKVKYFLMLIWSL